MFMFLSAFLHLLSLLLHFVDTPPPKIFIHPQKVRGALTEGRFLVFESGDHALTFDNNSRGLKSVPAAASHDDPSQRLILHATAPPPATTFNIQFAGSSDMGFVGRDLKESKSIQEAAVFNITDLGFGKGYTVQQVSSGSGGGQGQFFSLAQGQGVVAMDHESQARFSVFSVTKSTDSGQGFLG